MSKKPSAGSKHSSTPVRQPRGLALSSSSLAGSSSLFLFFFATNLPWGAPPWHTPLVETTNTNLCDEPGVGPAAGLRQPLGETTNTNLCDPLPSKPPCGLRPCQLLLREARQQ